jgi:hypothetical protein
MSSGSEQIDDVLEWHPSPPQAARASVLGALRYGVCRAWSSKALLGYLWLFYFLLVERGAAVLLAALRSAPGWGDATDAIVQSATATSMITAPTATAYRDLVMASLERPIWSPEAYFVLFYGLLAGGVIAYLHAPRPAPVLAQLGANCGMYLGRFVRLLVIAALLWWLLALIAGLLFSSPASGAAVWVEIIALQLAVTVVAMALDYARVRTVARDSRSMVIETWRSIRFVVANLPRTFALHLLLLALGAATASVFFGIAVLIGLVLPSAIAAVVGEQLFVTAMLWVRLAMWGAEMALYQGLTAASLAKSGTPGKPSAR